MRPHVGRGWAARLLAVGMLIISTPAAAQPSLPSSRTLSQPVDQVTAFVSEAARRFGLPEDWIRAVMRTESDGVASSTSRKGAVGLMQVMPQTYAELRTQLGLGPNPYDPHDNILAGAAYLRAMFDRYGPTGMLAAYNAGPRRWDAHVAGVRALPPETVRYVARLAPMTAATPRGLSPKHGFPVRRSPAESPLFVPASTPSSPSTADGDTTPPSPLFVPATSQPARSVR